MTFVAHPYEQFVDDLLTAITGGVIREEHQFIGIDESYSLASAGVLPASIKVVGQHNEEYRVFELGIDFVYVEEQGAIRWKPDGRVPDDRSAFYVSYYRTNGVRRLTDRNPGGVAATLSEAFAREFAVLHRQMEMIYKSAFVDLATGSSLDHIGALLGLTRKDAKFASGEVLFKRSTPAPADIEIPTGMLVSTGQGVNFETTDKRTLRRGQLSVIAPIRAQVEGPQGKVDAGAIQIINRPIFGVESIESAGTFFATAKESDEEYRRRIKMTLERAGRATVDAIKYSLIEEIPEITESNIQVTEKMDTPGIVEVRLGLETAGDADLVRRVEEAIFYARPAGVRVTHNLPTRTATESAIRAEWVGIPRDRAVADFRARGEPADATMLPETALAAMPEGVLELQAEVLLRLTEPNVTAAQKEGIEDQVREVLKQYIENLPMGEAIIYNKLLGRIVQPDAVADAVLLIGAKSDGEFQVMGNLSTSGRKAKIDPSDVFVGLMEESVLLDVRVELQPKPVDGAGSAQVTGALNAAVTDAINLKIAAAKGTLLKADIVAAIRTALDDTGLQLADGNSVVLSAEFEETGRLLSDPNEITPEENERPVLRNLTLEVKGPLDG